MTPQLANSAKRVQDFLAENGYSFEVKQLPGSTRTALEAAESVGCTVSQIAKSLIFKDQDTNLPVLIIASGSNRVDLQKVTKATGLHLGKADGNFVKETVGYAIGGIPPVGHTTPLRTILDPDLKKYEVIWAAAGTPFAVFQLQPADLAYLTNGEWVEIAEY
jgi:prolyl-tRNA editing enzyme YbaK/EbsC (Cys-tRNA(Pro) deacylase)